MTEAGDVEVREALLSVANADAPSVRTAEVPVSAHAIATWCAAVGDDNPLHHPERGAAQVAPIGMLQTWAAPRTEAGKRANPTVHARVRESAAALGLDSIVATDYELNRYRDLRPGDVVTESCWVADVSDRKSTALGAGHFVTIAFTMRNQAGDLVGTLRARTLYYAAGRRRTSSEPNAASPGGREPVLQERRPETLDVTRSMVVIGAVVSNDYEPVHHDHEVAHQQGLRDIIISIVTTAGLMCGYATRAWDVSQPSHVSLRLGAPVFPGDRLTFSGEPDQERRIPGRVRVRATHATGLHCAALVAQEPAPPSREAR